MSSIEEAWAETLLIPPPDVVAMWGQMEDSGDCFGFKLRKRNVTNWRVVRHGSLQLDQEKIRIRGTDQTSHLSVCTHLSETHAAERSARGEAAKQYTKKRGEERRRERKHKKVQFCCLVRTRSSFHLSACQMNPSLKSGGLMSARRKLERNGRARSMSSALGVLTRAAHRTQRRPDGMKPRRSRPGSRDVRVAARRTEE